VADDLVTGRAQTAGHGGAEETEADEADGRHAAQQALQGG
jgi:hypothetical protein